VLRCELNTLGYPPAALFGFCLAVVMYNALNTVVTALRTAHWQALIDREKAGKRARLSFYYRADEIAGAWRGASVSFHRRERPGQRKSVSLDPRLLGQGRRYLCRVGPPAGCSWDASR